MRALWLHSGTGDDARNLLSVIVSAMMTMATLVFSMTIVSLSVAASQFGSRLVRSYARDTRSKIALGIFAMTIIYCLLALRSVSSEMPTEAVPHVTVSVGLVLSVLCVLTMLVFLHMVAHAIVVDEVIRRVGVDLEETIAALAPRTEARHTPPLNEEFEGTEHPLLAHAEGYIQAIRYEHVMLQAYEGKVFVRLDLIPGDYVAQGDRLGSYYTAGGDADAEIAKSLLKWVLIGAERTPVQDLAFSIRHLVDVALRALSPGINDANTARVVIDRLRGALSRLFSKQLPDGRYLDCDGLLRLAALRHTHLDHVRHALDPIRHSAASQPVVVVSLIEALTKLMAHTEDPTLLRFMMEQAEVTATACEGSPHDLTSVQRALQRAREYFMSTGVK